MEGRMTVGSIIAKVIKVILIMIILILYRIGNNGGFLGVGGTFNLYEDRTMDVEILASGVFVGFLVYNLSLLITYFMYREKLLNDCIMNVIGIFLWIAVGGTALHYWDSYGKQEYLILGNERSCGLALGSLCIINAFVHIADTIITVRIYLSKWK